jgi:hypothetical protein
VAHDSIPYLHLSPHLYGTGVLVGQVIGRTVVGTDVVGMSDSGRHEGVSMVIIMEVMVAGVY